MTDFAFVHDATTWRPARPYPDAGRALDIIGSAIGLVLLALPFFLVALSIRIESRGSALFRQQRVGKDGRLFTLYKFRSMYIDAEARRAALLDQSDRGGVCFKARNDPRVTRVGRFIRKTSIDELPQLLNVLLGDMSLVGPRPALQSEVDAYPERARGRLALRPGITGLCQVSGRADIGFDKMVDLDLAYVRSRNILLDVAILTLTVRAVLRCRGAY